MPRKMLSMQERRRRTIITVAALFIVVVAVTLGYTTGFIGRLMPFNGEGYLRQPPPGNFATLDWQVLLQGTWPEDENPAFPAAVKPLKGKPVTVRGFLLPLHPGRAPEFFIAPKPRGCYFCIQPGIAEVIKVNLKGGRVVDITDRPVEVYGTLHLAADSTYHEESLYGIDDAELVVR
jgi:hypothetical protein